MNKHRVSKRGNPSYWLHILKELYWIYCILLSFHNQVYFIAEASIQHRVTEDRVEVVNSHWEAEARALTPERPA